MLTVAALAGPTSARAFTEPRTYYEGAHNGGGGGRWFTGSPAEGYGCGVCHSGQRSERVEVEGLPAQGYEPGESYDIRVTWPAFAERAQALREEAGTPPGVSLVAELVAEDGQGAGRLEIAAATDAAEGELCLIPPGQQAAQLYAQRPGEPTEEEGLSCDADALGRRCLLAMLSCGADQLRFRWTAPEQPRGPIWFALGFVATDEVSGDPFDDAVTELRRAMPPRGGAQPVHRLQGGCSTAPGGRGGAAALLVTCLTLLLLRRRRRASRSLLALIVLGAGCAPDATPEYVDGDSARREDPLVGLYTPGSMLGYAPPDGGADDGGGLSEEQLREIEETIAQAELEDRCMDLGSDEGTPGMLELEFQTATYGGFYEPENCGAVWIEDEQGHYVATPVVWAQLRLRNIFIWNSLRCPTDTPDVISSATLSEHGTHRVMWDATDRQGRVVPDGTYVVNIEVTEDEFNYGRRSQFSFVKGTEPVMLEPPDEQTVVDLTLRYMPTP